MLSSFYDLARHNAAAATATASVGIIILLFLSFRAFKLNSDHPPYLPETIPFLTNTLQISRNPQAFWERASRTMRKLNTEILRFRLAGRAAFLIVGEKKTSTLFRPNSGLSVDYYHNLLVHIMFDPSKKDMARFIADVSGRGKDPLPGTENIAEQDRIWMAWHHIFAHNLLHTKPTNELAALFFDNFMANINNLFEVGEWHSIHVVDFIYRYQTESAARALNGSRVFEKNPRYFELLNDFELAIMPIAFGIPRWMNPKPHRAREKYLAMNRKYVEEALRDYDWSSPEASSSWEPTFGSPLIRSLIRWGLDAGMDTKTISGIFGIQVVNQNSNSVPAAAWSIVNVLTCTDPELLKNIRQEAQMALSVDAETGKRRYDIQKLVTSPWLQAVYAETLRLRVGFSITRDAARDTQIDGFFIKKGSMVQAPIHIAHHNAIWETEGYPAHEFWPHRHLKPAETTDANGSLYTKKEFSLGSRSGYWIPYGGGVTMCPGRHFAKQEIIGTLALFVTQFEIEVTGWVKSDGSPSNREARNGPGMVIFQPDRDLAVKVKRNW